MSWTKDHQSRLNDLRAKELTDTLSATEHAELAALMACIEAEEAQMLEPEVQRLRTEIDDTARELQSVERDNDELARLLAREQALVADARRFLGDFERRRAAIMNGLDKLTHEPVPST